jgi:hypothetical protein
MIDWPNKLQDHWHTNIKSFIDSAYQVKTNPNKHDNGHPTNTHMSLVDSSQRNINLIRQTNPTIYNTTHTLYNQIQ